MWNANLNQKIHTYDDDDRQWIKTNTHFLCDTQNQLEMTGLSSSLSYLFFMYCNLLTYIKNWIIIILRIFVQFNFLLRKYYKKFIVW